MQEYRVESGLAPVNGTLIYYETAGEGQPLVMIHARVDDHRQWNNEFAHFARCYRRSEYLDKESPFQNQRHVPAGER